MRWKTVLGSLLGVAAFCAYLVTACQETPERPGVQAPEKTEAVLLSHATRVEALPEPAPAPETEIVTALPVTPPAPAPAPAPDEARAEAAAPKYREVWAVVTAYCPCRRCCGSHANGRTSTGTTAWKPGIAADPQVIPYGSKVYVEGYGLFTVDDTGGAMRRAWRRSGMIHIDVRMTYHYEARKWGRKIMRIRIYEPEN